MCYALCTHKYILYTELGIIIIIHRHLSIITFLFITLISTFADVPYPLILLSLRFTNFNEHYCIYSYHVEDNIIQVSLHHIVIQACDALATTICCW